MMYLSKPRVLIVDDEAHIRDGLAMLIDSQGYEVIGEAANGNEAIEFLKTKKADLVLLDINMPYKSGDEVLLEVSDLIHTFCAIVLSITTDPEINKKCTALGASGFIRKDISLSEITNIIEECWKNFEKNRKKAAFDKYDFRLIMQEIEEDEMINLPDIEIYHKIMSEVSC